MRRSRKSEAEVFEVENMAIELGGILIEPLAVDPRLKTGDGG
jgi:hypothetical protein